MAEGEATSAAVQDAAHDDPPDTGGPEASRGKKHLRFGDDDVREVCEGGLHRKVVDLQGRGLFEETNIYFFLQISVPSTAKTGASPRRRSHQVLMCFHCGPAT